MFSPNLQNKMKVLPRWQLNFTFPFKTVQNTAPQKLMTDFSHFPDTGCVLSFSNNSFS
jgi:hypothetical protein